MKDRLLTKGYLLIVILAGMIFLTQCGKDDGPTLASDTDLSVFSINGVAFTVDAVGMTIENDDEFPYGTDVSALVATFTVSGAATVLVGDIEQVSGVTANDFTNPVTYTIVAENKVDMVDFTVTVNVSATAWNMASENKFVGLKRPAALTHDGKLFLLGGAEVGGDADATPPTPADYYEYVYSSEDGVSWTTVFSHDALDLANSDSIPVGSFLSAVSLGGKIITVGGHTPPTLVFGVLLSRDALGSASSSDGSSWTVTALADLTLDAGEGFNAVKPGLVVHNDAIYMHGYMEAAFSGAEQSIKSMDILKSTNGVNWQTVAAGALSTIKTTDSPPTFAANFSFGGDLYIAGGVSGAAFITETADRYSSSVYKSSDNGATWSVASSDGFPAVALAQVVEYKGKLIAIAGATGDDTDAVYTSDVYVSDDGTTWTKQTGGLALPAEFAERAFHNVVVLNDKIYIIGGENAQGALRDVWVGEFVF
ncbi:MAG: hypothetical protein GDA51_07485 [Ekhidna sp.]|nr:hypothetical protein [Ekhidna sp.]